MYDYDDDERPISAPSPEPIMAPPGAPPPEISAFDISYVLGINLYSDDSDDSEDD